VLTVVLGNSYEELAPIFAEDLGRPRSGLEPIEMVMNPEWVVTPSAGVRRWLVTEVAKYLGASRGQESVNQPTDGVVAHWANDFPSRVTSRVLNAHLERHHSKTEDPWALPQLQFAIYDWAQGNPHAAEAVLVKTGDGKISLSRSRQVADLFDRYFTWRPQMIRDWVAPDYIPQNDLEKSQRALWLSVRSLIGVPTAPERWSEAWDDLSEVLPSLPARDRVSIFGVSTFPGGMDYVDAISRLSAHVDVTVYLVRPLGPTAVPFNSDQNSFRSSALRMWGAASLAMAPLVDEMTRRADVNRVARPRNAISAPASSALAVLQRMLRDDRVSPLAKCDATVIVHNCHGEARQVEVLRDAIHHELAMNPYRQESEILVVCPEIDKYETLIRTAFGDSRMTASANPQPQLAYRIADPSVANEGFYLRALRHLLATVGGQCKRSEILALLSEPAVRRARSFDENCMELFSQWTKEAGIRWGLNSWHRELFEFAALGDSNTWEIGLHRLALGSMVENPRLRAVDKMLPVEVAPGHFEELILLLETMSVLKDAVTDAHTGKEGKILNDWFVWFDVWVHQLVKSGNGEAQEFERVMSALAPLRSSASFSLSTLTYVDFATLLDDALASIGSMGPILTGGVTITSPDSLRGVSFPSVYILGFDEGAFAVADLERSDLRRASRQQGDVHPSDDARGRLRELILCAQERLTIVRSSFDVNNNSEIENGVAFSELLDALHEAQTIEDEKWVMPLQVQHPRNSFDPVNFDAEDSDRFEILRNEGVIATSWSFSVIDKSLTNVSTRKTWTEFFDTSEVAPPGYLALRQADLAALLINPPKVFVKETLGISLNSVDDSANDDIDAQMNGLVYSNALVKLWEEERADIDSRSSVDLEAGIVSLTYSGDVPPEPILQSDTLLGVVNKMAEFYRDGIAMGVREHRSTVLSIGGCELSVELDVIVGDERVTLVEVMTSKLSLPKVLDIWVRAVLLRAIESRPVRLHLVYRLEPDGGSPSVFCEPFDIECDAETAKQELEKLVKFYKQNLVSPVPFSAGQTIDSFGDPPLEDEIWRGEAKSQSYKLPYLGDPYWKLALGHLDAVQVRTATGEYAFRSVHETVKELLDNAFPLFSFVGEKTKKKT